MCIFCYTNQLHVFLHHIHKLPLWSVCLFSCLLVSSSASFSQHTSDHIPKPTCPSNIFVLTLLETPNEYHSIFNSAISMFASSSLPIVPASPFFFLRCSSTIPISVNSKPYASPPPFPSRSFTTLTFCTS